MKYVLLLNAYIDASKNALILAEPRKQETAKDVFKNMVDGTVESLLGVTVFGKKQSSLNKTSEPKKCQSCGALNNTGEEEPYCEYCGSALYEERDI